MLKPILWLSKLPVVTCVQGCRYIFSSALIYFLARNFTCTFCLFFSSFRMVNEAMRDSDGPVVFKNLCPPQLIERKTAAKVFYHLLGK